MRSSFVDEIEDMIPALRRFSQSLARNAADAADLLQDTLERALGRSHQFQEGTNLKAWLFTIMRNRFYTVCRHATLTRQHAEERLAGMAPGDHAASGGQMARIESCELALAFGQLTAGERALLVMASVEEMPYETIARLLEVEIGTVKSRVSRVRAKLRAIQASKGAVALACAGRGPTGRLPSGRLPSGRLPAGAGLRPGVAGNAAAPS